MSYDYIFPSTSLSCLLLAHAYAKKGASVLVCDKRSTYGDLYAPLEKQQLEKLTNQTKTTSEHSKSSNIDLSKYILDAAPPILLPAAHPFTNVMIQTNIDAHVEFRKIDAVYVQTRKEYDSQTNDESRIQRVPYTKEDIFNNRTITLKEKRTLMKFLAKITQDNLETGAVDSTQESQALSEEGISQGAVSHRAHVTATTTKSPSENEEPFLEYLTLHIGADWAEIITAAIDDNEDMNVEQGLAAFKIHADSVRRFGGTPFLTPLYGASEFSQALARQAAVNGAVFKLITGTNFQSYEEQDTGSVCRAIYLTNDPILPHKCALLISTRLKIRMVQLSDCGISPDGVYVLHMTTQDPNNAKERFEELRRSLNFNETSRYFFHWPEILQLSDDNLEYETSKPSTLLSGSKQKTSCGVNLDWDSLARLYQDHTNAK